MSPSLEQIDRENLIHPFTAIDAHRASGPRIMASGKGVWVRDSEGREYLDAMAGLWCVNVGYGREEIADAIAEQARTLAFYHSFASMANEPAIRLAERLVALAPGRLGKVFFGNSGSDANDTQVKLVWYYNNLRGRPQKKKIISQRRAFHGVTLGAASMAGLQGVHAGFDLPLPGFLQTAAPDPYRGLRTLAAGASEPDYAAKLAADLDALIEREGADTVAAFIAEPVMGAGGVVVPPAGYFREIQQVLARHDVLMIADEVICGFGRLGRMFGSEVLEIEPDLMTLAKGLTSGYVPMSACLVSDEIFEVMSEGAGRAGPFNHGTTYSGHPVAAAAALANLDIIEGSDLLAHARVVGGRLQHELRERFSDHPLVGDVRGLGLIAGVELVADRETATAFDPGLSVGRRLSARLAEDGLLCRPVGDILAFSPALVISDAEIDILLDRFGRGLSRISDELVAEGVWKPS